MKIDESPDICPNCLGEKTVFNGSEYETCPLCFGDGYYFEEEPSEEDLFVDDDYVPFDENEHSEQSENDD